MVVQSLVGVQFLVAMTFMLFLQNGCLLSGVLLNGGFINKVCMFWIPPKWALAGVLPKALFFSTKGRFSPKWFVLSLQNGTWHSSSSSQRRVCITWRLTMFMLHSSPRRCNLWWRAFRDFPPKSNLAMFFSSLAFFFSAELGILLFNGVLLFNGILFPISAIFGGCDVHVALGGIFLFNGGSC